MPALRTDAVVLHAFDYLESSRILRLATREAGVRSVLARGARRSSKRFGSALDLFAQGAAQLHTKPGRELDTLASFDVVRARSELGADLARFMGASTIAELTLRFAREGADEELFDVVVAALDALADAPVGAAREAALAGAWRIIDVLGFGPNLDNCCSCDAELPPEEQVLFSHPAGGALCSRCSRMGASGRVLPSEARTALRAWTAGDRVSLGSDGEERAHQRLLREFLHEHLVDNAPLRAFAVWEHADWDQGAGARVP